MKFFFNFFEFFLKEKVIKLTLTVTVPRRVNLYPSFVNFWAAYPEHWTLFESLLLSIRLAVLTVSPKRQ